MSHKAPWKIPVTELVGIVLLIAGLTALPGESFGQIAKGQSKFIGNVIGMYFPRDFTKYWDQVTPENAGKWGSVGVSEDPAKWNWAPVEAIYKYAIEHHFPFKFHNLVWGPQQPRWIASLPPAKQKKMVEYWISEAGKRFPKAAMVDVVNEPIQKPPVYKQALGGDGSTGWDWVIWSYEQARKAFPHAKLILNEYDILDSVKNAKELVHIVDILKSRHLVDAIGLQGHKLENVDIATIESNLKIVESAGLPIYISEYDVDEANDAAQLAIYKQQFPLFWTNPDVKGITFWGYKQGAIWRTNAYLVRRDGSERPALTWIIKYVASTRKPG